MGVSRCAWSRRRISAVLTAGAGRLVRRFGARGQGSGTRRSPPDFMPRPGCSDGGRGSTPVTSALEPLEGRAAGRCRMERPALSGRDSGAAGQVRGDLRRLLERRRVRDVRPRTRRDRLDDALGGSVRARAQPSRHLTGGSGGPRLPAPAGDAGPWKAERQIHGRHRNLVVAATGTGKTVVAALDFRRLGVETSGEPSAVRRAPEEILQQARRTYREVLGNGPFGELYVDGARPTVEARVRFGAIAAVGTGRLTIPRAYDIVVIDEFHHAEATTYRASSNSLAPRAARPDRDARASGRCRRARLLRGRIALEMRPRRRPRQRPALPVPLLRGIADGTDLRRIAWTRGRYDDRRARRPLHRQHQLEPRSFSANCATRSAMSAAMRGARVLRQRRSRAVHGASTFKQAGIPAAAVSGDYADQ